MTGAVALGLVVGTGYVIGAASVATGAQPAAAAACNLIGEDVSGGASGTVAAMDLALLRDIPWPQSFSGERGYGGLSPDGRSVAVEVRQANPVANSYCAGIVIVPIRGGERPRVIDVFGEVTPAPRERDRALPVPNGSPHTVVPKWSPNGRSVAYLRSVRGIAQVWRAIIGQAPIQVTNSLSDVEDFFWSADGAAIFIKRQPEQRPEREALERERRGGYLYDDRFDPRASNRPLLQNIQQELVRVDLQSKRVTALSSNDLASDDSVNDPVVLENNPPDAVSVGRKRAWRSSPSVENPVRAGRIFADLGDGHIVECSASACAGAEGLWWTADGHALTFMRRDGWGDSQISFYRWRPGEGSPQRIFATEDLLLGCRPAGSQFLCAHEASTKPRRLVLLDPDKGSMRVLFDPNPSFSHKDFGTVERLHWQNAFGVESFGDLILPPDHRPGQRHPLIVVQYRTRGFLRGGTGDEYPIHVFAARGYAVLSFDRPRHIGYSAPAKDVMEVEQRNLIGWTDRRSVQSSLELGVELAISRGAVDANRIGITGLSDGATTVEYALSNTSLFAAAAISSCCISPGTLIALADPQNGRRLTRMGYPGPSIAPEAQTFWKPFSIVADPQRVATPILMQLADREYLWALEVFTALKQHGKAVELHVFPDEYHIKIHPAHRLAIYERNLDWFDFWLKGREDPNPEKQEQYERWREMRNQQATSTP